MRAALAQLVGLALVVAAGFVVAMPLGLAAAGAAVFLVGLAMEGEEES